MKNKINFVTFFDKNFLNMFLVHYQSILSLYDQEEFTYWVGGDKFVKDKIEFLGLKNVFVKNIENLNDKKFDSVMIEERISIFTMARLKMFEHFGNLKKLNNIVYIDADTIMRRKINPNYFNSNKNLSVVEVKKNNKNFDQVIRYWYKKIDNSEIKFKIMDSFFSQKYFNAGIIIINDINKLERLLLKALDSKIKLDDQTLLNLFNKNEIKVILDDDINCIIKYVKYNDQSIIHLAGLKKISDPRKLKIEEDIQYIVLLNTFGLIDCFLSNPYIKKLKEAM